MFEQSERFRTALMQTRGMTLIHTCGESNPYKTILTPAEFCSILTEIRDNYDRRDKTLELKAKSVPQKTLIYLDGSSHSSTCSIVRLLCEQLPEFEIVSPTLSVEPTKVLSSLQILCFNKFPNVIIGTNLNEDFIKTILIPFIKDII